MRTVLRLFAVTAVIFLTAGLTFAGEKVFYYHTDPAGTPLAMTDVNGAVVWRADYRPFGEEQSIDPQTTENDMKFVGKEKDKETGLYYFGARYMRPEIGRFVTIDPVGPVDPRTSKTNYAMLANPQRLNRYAYSLNNPYRYVDPDGKWAEEIHNRIINEAFQGSWRPRLSDRALRMFRQASAYVDTFQDPKYSYMHGMKAEGQSVEEATKLMNDFIGGKVADYKRLMAERKTDEAYFALGMAMHPLMDSTSPSHEGMQEWKSPWTHPMEARDHMYRETSDIFNSNPGFLNKSVDMLRKFYHESNQ
ncbi:MAG: RHS domain-containing protein [Nitrospirae bacterium]|nr:RHS domain-containing protein [Nitrospirota bacterium]